MNRERRRPNVILLQHVTPHGPNRSIEHTPSLLMVVRVAAIQLAVVGPGLPVEHVNPVLDQPVAVTCDACLHILGRVLEQIHDARLGDVVDQIDDHVGSAVGRTPENGIAGSMFKTARCEVAA